MGDFASLQGRELSRLLNDISQDAVNLEDQKKREANYLLETFLRNRLINEMKSQYKIFRDIYQRIFYTGSYYDGLKVGEPNEFDINVVLKLPKVFHMSHVHGPIPGYKYYLTKENPGQYGFLFQQTYSGDYYLVPEKLMNWIQGILHRSLNSIISDEEFSTYRIKDVKCSRSGPAWTLHLYSSANSLIDVDFVPVFSYLDDENDEIFLVPKPPDFTYDHGVDKLWRLSFAQKERKEIKKLCNVGQSCFKKITKLLKYLRDQQGAPLKKLASFFIKNFMLLEKQNNPNIKWDDEKNLGVYFCSLLTNLHKTMQSGFMPSYFEPNYNVLESLKKKRREGSSSALDNIVGNLGRISTKINKNPLKYIPKYFNYGFVYQLQSGLEDSSSSEEEDDVGYADVFAFEKPRSNASEQKGEKEGLSGLSKVAIGIGAFVGISALAYGLSNLFTENDDDKKDKKR